MILATSIKRPIFVTLANCFKEGDYHADDSVKYISPSQNFLDWSDYRFSNHSRDESDLLAVPAQEADS